MTASDHNVPNISTRRAITWQLEQWKWGGGGCIHSFFWGEVEFELLYIIYNLTYPTTLLQAVCLCHDKFFYQELKYFQQFLCIKAFSQRYMKDLTPCILGIFLLHKVKIYEKNKILFIHFKKKIMYFFFNGGSGA